MNQNDQLFLDRFESLKIDPSEFNHIAHLRLAFLYIEQEGVEVAVRRVKEGIKAFADSLGAERKFHQTITEALVRLMDVRLRRQPVVDWAAFLKANPDLVDNAYGVLLRYYSTSRLNSDEARVRFLEPDQMPLEE